MLADAARRCARHALRVAVAAAAGPRAASFRIRSCIPYSDQTLSLALKKETELFFDSLVREDRSLLDLLTADYTYVERARRASLRHSERHRRRVPARHAAGRSPRHSRPRQRPDADLDRRSHVAGDARQVGDGSAARIAAAAAAAERAGARGDEGHRRYRPRAVGARADGAAPQQPAVHVVPSRDRSARPGARELRRHRQVAHSRRRHDRSTRRAQLFDGTSIDRPGRACATRCCATRTSCC